MVKELKFGQMVHNILEIMLMVKKMEKENLNGVMELHMKENLKTIILKVNT